MVGAKALSGSALAEAATGLVAGLIKGTDRICNLRPRLVTIGIASGFAVVRPLSGRFFSTFAAERNS
ncbi:MAG: hypothetical protein EBU34_14805 [Alphaproteobacteria bacterium]|nr:hypothetical protein [Alphaproteobacteria bacterium]